MKKCQFCGKELKKKQKYRVDVGRHLEWPCEFRIRKYCGLSCSSKATTVKRGRILWSKDLIKSKFAKIKSKSKYNSSYLNKSYYPLHKAIMIYFGGINKFLYSIKKEHKILHNYKNPIRKRTAREYIKYLTVEQKKKVGDRFVLSADWNEPGINENAFHRKDGLNYLVKNKNLKILKRGAGGSAGGFHGGYPTEYKLMRTRI